MGCNFYIDQAILLCKLFVVLRHVPKKKMVSSLPSTFAKMQIVEKHNSSFFSLVNRLNGNFSSALPIKIQIDRSPNYERFPKQMLLLLIECCHTIGLLIG